MANATVIIVWCLVTAQNPHLHLRTEKAYKTCLKQALSKACLNPGLTLGAPAPSQEPMKDGAGKELPWLGIA